MGRCIYMYIFHSRVAINSTLIWFNLGYSWPNDEVGPFHSHKGFLLGGRLCQVKFEWDGKIDGVTLYIISHRGTKFTLLFWRSFQKGLGTKFKHSTILDTQADGKAERTIQTLEDVLKAFMINWKGNCYENIPLIEFSSNNSYNSSIGMAPFEAIYSRRCRSPVSWFEVDKFEFLGCVYEALEKIWLIRQMSRTTQSRQNSYADVRRRDHEFDEIEWFYFKFSPIKGAMRFGKKYKCISHFIDQY